MERPLPLPRFRKLAISVLGILLCFFTLAEVNFPRLQIQSALAIFVLLGLVLCFLAYPIHPRLKDVRWLRYLDLALALLGVICCGYVVLQTEPRFDFLWSGGQSLGDRAGIETSADFVFRALGLLIVFEATRRSIG